jgi:hypothetical protein
MNGMGAIRKAAAGVALAVGLSIAAVGGAGAASAQFIFESAGMYLC